MAELINRLRQSGKKLLEEKYNRRYQNELSRRRLSYHDWVTEQERIWAETADAETAGAPSDAGSEFVILRAPEGRLSALAEHAVSRWMARHPETLLLYGDEDVWSEGQERTAPQFRPEWSPELMESRFYLGNAVAVRRGLYESLELPETLPYRERVLACVRRIAGEYGDEAGNVIRHIPVVLCHGEVTSPEKDENGDSADEPEPFRWAAAEPRRFARNLRGGHPVLSIVIPSKDHPELLRSCLEGIRACRGELPLEVLVIDNGSSEDNRTTVYELIQHSDEKYGFPVWYLYEPAEFHFSHMCNLGAARASGEVLLFLNDDVELCEPDCLARMLRLAVRSGVGAVGIKLLYPDSARIQHAGIVNLPMGPVHKLQFLDDKEEYYQGWNRGLRNALAVTAACLMVEKEKFDATGGFPDELRVAFNDVDLCFSLYEKGYRNVVVCDRFAYHHESVSRGDDESAEKLARLLAERAKLYERHPALQGIDPYYPQGMARDALDTRLRFAYETVGNDVQRVTEPLRKIDAQTLADCRQDDCLMLRVETAEPYLTGWSVVLGDNNACYDRKLLLKCCDGVYELPIQPQYRPDLAENMPDQVNVALCGFCIDLTEARLPQGNYQVGVRADRLVGQTALVNWSAREVEIFAAR